MRYEIDVIDVGNALQNYIWVIIDTQNNEASVVDPTDADLVLDYCDTHQLKLKQIWVTHKHGDHIGGVPKLKEKTNAIVYIPQHEQEFIPVFDHTLDHGDEFKFNDLNIEVIFTPGHTLGHICLFIDEIDALFSGDTLFAMGCGRLFEGTYEQMYHSLNRLAALPPRTKVYCTHEYTESNAKFAITVEPENLALQQRLADVILARQQQQITLPSTIELELKTNPFLRCQNVEQFQDIRKLKDQF